MALKYKYIKIDDNIFKATIHVLVNCTQEKFNKWLLTKFNAEHESISCAGCCVSIDTGDDITEYCVWVGEFNWRIMEQGHINHELTHCAYTILKDRGINMVDATEEVFAYYHTYLFEEVYKKLVKKKVKKK